MVSKPQIFALFTAMGLLHFFYKYLEQVAVRNSPDWRAYFVDEMTATYAAMALLPWVAYIMGRNHVLGVVVFSVAKTSLMWGARYAIWWGNYDYGKMPVRYLMEFPADVIGYTILVGVMVFLRRQKELERIRMENLSLQLQPHFLFNAMNAISATVYEDARKADLMLSRLAEYLRRTLQLGEAQEAPVERELEMLDLYVSVMKARFEDKLTVDVQVGEGVKSLLVPQLVLQPLVENAIRHGGAGLVEVRVVRDGDVLRLTVRDTGGGTTEQGMGIGLANTQERLRHLYGRAGRLTMEKSELGTEVVVELPCRISR